MDRPPVAGLEENILQELKATDPKNGQGMGRKGGRTRSVALTVALETACRCWKNNSGSPGRGKVLPNGFLRLHLIVRCRKASKEAVWMAAESVFDWH